ncbi:MAG TPA: prepilin-type N-terminal cleavage/methylation domain-containing protein [Chthoniobacteraceae bacterium]|nr:prepilin-type N-terminal cleavage/methylation domain-containing protein [Chthoniobacteraceae bacterium]
MTFCCRKPEDEILARRRPGVLQRRPRGFSATELLIVVAIVLIIGMLSFPVYRRLRLQSDTLYDLNTLRSYQRANMVYAAEHDGWYVPLMVLDVETITGLDYWYRNRQFRSYLGVPPDPSGSVSHYPPSFHSRRKKGFTSIYGWRGTDFSYNDDIHGGSSGRIQPVYQARASQIHRPSQTLAFASSCDWYIIMRLADSYTEKLDETTKGIKGAIAYRYGGKALVCYFDGSTALLSREEVVENRRLWYNDP